MGRTSQRRRGVTFGHVDAAGLPALVEAIRHLHGCEARWVESVPVHETHEGRTVWDGEVQVFDLVGHPKAQRAYAWSHATTGTKRRFVAVLGQHMARDGPEGRGPAVKLGQCRPPPPCRPKGRQDPKYQKVGVFRPRPSEAAGGARSRTHVR